MPQLDAADAQRFFDDCKSGRTPGLSPATYYDEIAQAYIKTRGLPESLLGEVVYIMDDWDSSDC